MREEVEIVDYPQMGNLKLMVNTVQYRTPHLHRELELLWLRKGRLQAIGPQQNILAEADEMLIFNPLQSHEFCTPDGACTFLCMQISPRLFRGTEVNLEQTVFGEACPFRIMDAASASECRRLMQELAVAYLEKGSCCELHCIGLTHLLLWQLLTRVPCHTVSEEKARLAREKADRLTRLLDFADQNYTHAVRLSDFAAQEHLSLGYLSHFARENLNRSFQEYVTELRFHQACKLLQSGGRSVLDVCFEAGFSDPRYLNEAFHTRLGVSPEEYRRSPTPLPSDPIYVHRSEHTMERFYSQAQSLSILRETEQHGPQ